jgi:hypothetical protein
MFTINLNFRKARKEKNQQTLRNALEFTRVLQRMRIKDGDMLETEYMIFERIKRDIVTVINSL